MGNSCPLQKVVRDATSSERRVDKLVQVWRKSGKQAWVYIHIDVQSQYETGFAKRMFAVPQNSHRTIFAHENLTAN